MRFVGFSSAEAGAVIIINSSDRQTSNRFIVISKEADVLTWLLLYSIVSQSWGTGNYIRTTY